MGYEVELTSVAECAYDKFLELAQPHFDKGMETHPAIRNFYAIQKALDETLPRNPYHPGKALAGDFDYLFVLSVARVSITYTIGVGTPKVYVQTITRKKPNTGAIREWLNTGIENGELSPVLETLGIEPFLMKVKVNSRYMH